MLSPFIARSFGTFGNMLEATRSAAPFDSGHTNGLGGFFTGTSGDDSKNGSSEADIFDYSQGGNDTLNGKGGADDFRFGAAFNELDHVTGGNGFDTLILKGDYSSAGSWDSSTITGIEKIKLLAGIEYDFFLQDDVVAAGESMVIDGTNLKVGQRLLFQGANEFDGTYEVHGGAGGDFISLGHLNDVAYGGHGNDQLAAGEGTDALFGGAGDDQASFSVLFTAGDSFDGGGGFDTLSAAILGPQTWDMTPTSLSDVENIDLQTILVPGSALHLIMDDANVGAGDVLQVYSRVGPDVEFALEFDGSAETDGRFDVRSGDANDSLTGGARADTFRIEAGGADTVHGGGGDDTIFAGASFDTTDQIDGGGGADVLNLDGDYSVGFALPDGAISGLETIVVAAGHSYTFSFDDGNVAAGATLTVDASALGAGEIASFNGTIESNGKFNMTGGAGDDSLQGGTRSDTLAGGGGGDLLSGSYGDDVLIGGAGGDTIIGGRGTDVIEGGSGHDEIFSSVQASTGPAHDEIVGFDFGADRFGLQTEVTGIDTEVTAGTLSQASFDTDMQAAIGSAELGRHHAVLFAPDAGDFNGTIFLVIDGNDKRGYQAGKDYVFELTDPVHVNQLDLTDFFVD